jgi:parallel beta-helix repeat protein
MRGTGKPRASHERMIKGDPMRRRKPIRLHLEELESRMLLSTFYVAPTGSDGAGGSPQAPWQTLQHAANVVQAGDTVVVEPGTYTGFNMTNSGQAGAPITFQAQAGVVINQPNSFTHQDGINLEGASYITITGFTVTGLPRAGIRAVTDNHVTITNNITDHNGVWGIFSGFSDYIDIENNTASNSQQQHGIYVSNSAVAPTIRNNIVFGNANCGIHMNGDVSQGGVGVITGAIVTGNIIYDNGSTGGSAINADGVQNSVIENNILYNNHASGISLFQQNASDSAKNNIVANNTIVMAADARWALNIQNGSTGNTVFNNILWNNAPGHGSVDISADSLPGFTSDGNIVKDRFTTTGGDVMLSFAQWQAQTGQDLHSILVSDPNTLFVNLAANDYHLLPGSPAIDHGLAGLAGQSAPSSDRDGNPRPNGAGFDIGAYEAQMIPSAPQAIASSTPVTLATGAGPGGGPNVNVYDANTGALKFSFFAYDPAFTGGVRVALGDINGDGTPDIITAPGPGGGPDIHVYDGRTGQLLRQFFAYNPAFTGGVYVAAGDVNGDGLADIICGADAGGGPNVTVFSGRDNSQLFNFFAFDPNFTGGVRVAAGDVNGDGHADLICGAGPGGGPNVTVFNGVTGARLESLFAFDPRFTGGVYVAAGDVNGDGRADLLVGAGPGGGPNVTVFDGSNAALLQNFFAYDPSFGGGVRVAAVDRDGNGHADIITGTGPGGGPEMRSFEGLTSQRIDDFYAYSPLFRGGLYVAAE